MNTGTSKSLYFVERVSVCSISTALIGKLECTTGYHDKPLVLSNVVVAVNLEIMFKSNEFVLIQICS